MATLIRHDESAEATAEILHHPPLDLPGLERPLLDVRAEVGAYTYATADSAEAREASLATMADAFRQDGHPDPRAAAEAELQRRGAIEAKPSSL